MHGQERSFRNAEHKYNLLEVCDVPVPQSHRGTGINPNMDALFNTGITERVVSTPSSRLSLRDFNPILPDETANLFGYQLLSRGRNFMDARMYTDPSGRPGAEFALCAALGADESAALLEKVRANPLLVRQLSTFCLREVFQLPESVVKPVDYDRLDTVSSAIALTSHPELVEPEEILPLR